MLSLVVLSSWLGYVGAAWLLLSVTYAIFRRVSGRRSLSEPASPGSMLPELICGDEGSGFLNMDHELRTPLDILLGNCRLLQDPGISRRERADATAAIVRNGKMMWKIIEDFLARSRTESGDPTVLKQVTSVSRLLEDLADLQVVVHSVGTLPQLIETDVALLRQLIKAVVDSARNFTMAGRVRITVSAAIDAGNHRLTFDVEDTGSGPHTLEGVARLCSPFGKSKDPFVQQHGNSGLGLSAARRIARSLGGNVELLARRPSLGSIFRITIAAGSVRTLARRLQLVREVADGEGEPPGCGVLSGMRILLVEDNPDVQKLVKRRLEGENAEVITASDGSEGVAAVHHSEFDAILMDIQMPKMDGISAVTKIRDSGFTKPIIAVTAYSSAEERTRCLSAGFSDHITKPIEYGLLFRKVIQP